MNHITIIVALAFGLSLAAALASNTIVYAQQVPSSSHSSPPLHPQGSSVKLHTVKIASPARGQQVPIGKNLTVSGVTSTLGSPTGNTAASNCQVSIIANGAKPYQTAKGTGPGGAADYSTWNYVLNSKYATIKPGPANKITAKYSCSDNPNVASFYSVNVTGAANNLHASQIAAPNTGVISSSHTPVVSAAHTPNPSPTTTAVKQKEQQPVVIGNSDVPSNIGSNTPGTHTTPAVTYERKPVVESGNSNGAGSNDNGSAIIAGINIPGTLGVNSAVTYEQMPVSSSNGNADVLNSNNSSGMLSPTSSLLGGNLINIGSSELSRQASNLTSSDHHSGYDRSSSSSSSRSDSPSFSHHTRTVSHQDNTGPHETHITHTSTVSHQDNTGPHETHITHTSTVSHQDNTGPHETHITHTSTVSHQHNSAGGSLQGKINGLKNSIIDKVKRELESNGIRVPLF
jgi:hypothetical protein